VLVRLGSLFWEVPMTTIERDEIKTEHYRRLREMPAYLAALEVDVQLEDHVERVRERAARLRTGPLAKLRDMLEELRDELKRARADLELHREDVKVTFEVGSRTYARDRRALRAEGHQPFADAAAEAKERRERRRFETYGYLRLMELLAVTEDDWARPLVVAFGAESFELEPSTIEGGPPAAGRDARRGAAALGSPHRGRRQGSRVG
jgi:hypothetical protein